MINRSSLIRRANWELILLRLCGSSSACCMNINTSVVHIHRCQPFLCKEGQRLRTNLFLMFWPPWTRDHVNLWLIWLLVNFSPLCFATSFRLYSYISLQNCSFNNINAIKLDFKCLKQWLISSATNITTSYHYNFYTRLLLTYPTRSKYKTLL